MAKEEKSTSLSRQVEFVEKIFTSEEDQIFVKKGLINVRTKWADKCFVQFEPSHLRDAQTISIYDAVGYPRVEFGINLDVAEGKIECVTLFPKPKWWQKIIGAILFVYVKYTDGEGEEEELNVEEVCFHLHISF